MSDRAAIPSDEAQKTTGAREDDALLSAPVAPDLPSVSTETPYRFTVDQIVAATGELVGSAAPTYWFGLSEDAEDLHFGGDSQSEALEAAVAFYAASRVDRDEPIHAIALFTGQSINLLRPIDGAAFMERVETGLEDVLFSDETLVEFWSRRSDDEARLMADLTARLRRTFAEFLVESRLGIPSQCEFTERLNLSPSPNPGPEAQA